MQKPEITAYLKTYCGWSAGVRAVLAKYNLPYTEKDIIQNPAFRWEMETKSGQPLSPCVEINGQMLPDVSGEEVERYLVENKLVEASDAATDVLELRRIRKLLRRALHPQAELFLQQRLELRLQLARILPGKRVSRVSAFHRVLRQPPISRCTNVVRSGSLAAASANASRASASSTPSISYNTLPGWISAT